MKTKRKMYEGGYRRQGKSPFNAYMQRIKDAKSTQRLISIANCINNNQKLSEEERYALEEAIAIRRREKLPRYE